MKILVNSTKDITKYKNRVYAAESRRDIIKKLERVKSSNVWAYGIDVRDPESGVGRALAQFKDKDGGPGDIYIYYDVPVSLFQKWRRTPSKGHFFWKYIRNRFKYSKLTGDKKGVLPNAVNR